MPDPDFYPRACKIAEQYREGLLTEDDMRYAMAVIINECATHYKGQPVPLFTLTLSKEV